MSAAVDLELLTAATGIIEILETVKGQLVEVRAEIAQKDTTIETFKRVLTRGHMWTECICVDCVAVRAALGDT
jgi:hypothetical protein